MPNPTLKQERFVAEYIKNNGNGTQAALKVYDTTKPDVAHAIASENLQKPTVREQLDKALAKERAKLDSVIENVVNIAAEKPIKGYTGADILEANKTLLKVHGVLTDRKVTTTYNVTAELSQKSLHDLIELRKQKSRETESILEGEIA